MKILDQDRPEQAIEGLVPGVSACPSCSAELEEFLHGWRSLPDALSPRAPEHVARALVEYASAVQSGNEPASRPTTGRTLGEVAVAAALGALAAAGLVALTSLRSGGETLQPRSLLALLASAAVLLAVTLAGARRAMEASALRASLGKTLGATGGYAALLLAAPLGDTVHVCGSLVFGGISLSLAQLCAVYLGVASAYAALPMAAVMFATRPAAQGRLPLRESVWFTIVAAPALLVQSGRTEAVIVGALLVGFGAGALLGGRAGMVKMRRAAG
ncbi:MAG: hypothetical protein L0271_01140 [Gemmatimonadetes bacterium]|nr:hypothetical protein [Gemmatimonadota bacterium]